MDKTIFTNQTFKIALKLYKKANREMVVNINKTELAKETELSRPTIIAIIKDDILFIFFPSDQMLILFTQILTYSWNSFTRIIIYNDNLCMSLSCNFI